MSLGAVKYGMPSLAPVTPLPVGSGAGNGAVTTDHRLGRLSADNPMLWLVGIGAATLGLIAASTSVRVGPIRASVSAGK